MKIVHVSRVFVANLIALFAASGLGTSPGDRMTTCTNPIDLPYRHQLLDQLPRATVSYREADPTIVQFRGRRSVSRKRF